MKKRKHRSKDELVEAVFQSVIIDHDPSSEQYKIVSKSFSKRLWELLTPMYDVAEGLEMCLEEELGREGE